MISRQTRPVKWVTEWACELLKTCTVSAMLPWLERWPWHESTLVITKSASVPAPAPYSHPISNFISTMPASPAAPPITKLHVAWRWAAWFCASSH